MAELDPEKLIREQFASSRRRLGGEKKKSLERLKGGFQRFAAANRLQGSGALLKAKGIQEQDVAQEFAGAERDVAGQEAQALSGLANIREQRKFAREERLGSQEFAAGEAAKEREAREGQFRETLEFQRDSFAQQLQFQWAEFNENTKTNFINTAIALREAGLDKAKNWDRLRQGLSRTGFTFDPRSFGGSKPGLTFVSS